MTLTHGIEESFHKSFVLTEDALKEFHKLMENAVQRFPAPAELVYTIVRSDFFYIQTKRLQDVTHDMDVQKKNIIQLIMEADFQEEPLKIEGNLIKAPLDNWNIRVIFSILQKDFWDTRVDRISLRVRSEDRKWAADYIDKFENLIYKLPRGEKTPTVIFWLFAIPLFLFIKTFIEQTGARVPADWYTQPGGRLVFFISVGITALLVLTGILVDVFGFRPYSYRLLFGPDSSFVWGQGKADHEARGYARMFSMWGIGRIFIFLLALSIRYAIN